MRFIHDGKLSRISIRDCHLDIFGVFKMSHLTFFTNVHWFWGEDFCTRFVRVAHIIRHIILHLSLYLTILSQHIY